MLVKEQDKFEYPTIVKWGCYSHKLGGTRRSQDTVHSMEHVMDLCRVGPCQAKPENIYAKLSQVGKFILVSQN